jgi:hypothetical protein
MKTNQLLEAVGTDAKEMTASAPRRKRKTRPTHPHPSCLIIIGGFRFHRHT